MGCGDSAPIAPRQATQMPVQNYSKNQNTMFYQMQTAKRPKFLNPQPTPQNYMDTIWSLVQRNAVNQFAYFIQNEKIPSNAEAGPPGAFWNFAHFCARWDAFQCLNYIIKRVYAENRTQYMSMINQQSIQGFTALHVAIQWNAINCFYLIIDCGAVDMSYTDKANNDVFAKAHLFKRQEMLQVLEKFRAANCLMVMLQSEKTYGFKSFAEMAAKGQKIPIRPGYRLTNQRIQQIIESRQRLNRPPPPPPPQNQNLQNQYQNYQNNIKKIEQSKGQMTSTEGQNQGDIILKKLQEQKRFQKEQQRIKRQKAEQLKKNLQKQRQQEQTRIRTEIDQQMAKQKQFQKAQLQKIQKQKQIMRKNIEMMSSVPSDNRVNKNSKLICPEDIRPKYEAALAKGVKFVDSQFPPELATIGDTSKFKFGWDTCVWLRPGEIFSGGKYQVFDGISPDDVKQGTLAVCYYLALLASIAEHQHRVKKIFRFYDKQLGFYAIQLYKQGKPTTMIVDDLIPCMKGTKEPLFAKPNGAQCWVMILQKAWVKMFGSYLDSQKFACNQMFENVLPSPCRYMILDASDIEKGFDTSIEYDKKHYIMTASSINDENIPGIVSEHAYSLMGSYNINGVRIAKLRNPWGKTQFAGGMYSDESTLWTNQLMKAVDFKKCQDGLFFMTPTEMHKIMPIITTSLYRDDYEYSWIQITSKSNQQIYFIVNVTKPGEIAMKLTQQNERFRKNMEFQDTRILFQILKIGDNYEAKYFSQGEPSTCYGGITTLYSHLDMYEKYEPGKYLIRLKVYYDRAHSISTRGTMRKFIRGTDGKNPLIVRSGTSVFSIYGPERYTFFKISLQQAQKYMKNAYRDQILTNPKTDERLRSVGQDLKPMVLAKSLQMKHQVIYCAQNHLQNNEINFKFQFKASAFRNVSYAYNVDKDTECCEWKIPPNGGWNICTLQVDFPVQEIATEGQLHPSFKIVR